MQSEPTARPESARALLADGFTCLRTASFKDEIDAIVAGMILLTENPDLSAYIGKLIVGFDEIGQAFDAGLWERDDGKERKSFFHYIPELDTRIRSMPHELRAFGEACSSLTEKMHHLLLSLAETLDAINAQIRSGHAYREPLAPLIARGIKVLRILRYLRQEPRTTQTFDATPHFDRAGFSVRTWESRPRTILYDRTGAPFPAGAVPDGDRCDDVLVFPGEKFAAATDGMFGNIGMHAVKDARTDSAADRFAVVLFQHLPLNEQAATWLRTHQPALEAFESACRLRAA